MQFRLRFRWSNAAASRPAPLHTPDDSTILVYLVNHIHPYPKTRSLNHFWRKMMATSEDVLVTVAGDGHAWPRQNSLRWLQDETGSTFLHQHVWLVPRKYTCDLWYIVSAPQDSKWIPCCWWALIWLQQMFASISCAFRSSPVAVTIFKALALGCAQGVAKFVSTGSKSLRLVGS